MISHNLKGLIRWPWWKWLDVSNCTFIGNNILVTPRGIAEVHPPFTMSGEQLGQHLFLYQNYIISHEILNADSDFECVRIIYKDGNNVLYRVTK